MAHYIPIVTQEEEEPPVFTMTPTQKIPVNNTPAPVKKTSLKQSPRQLNLFGEPLPSSPNYKTVHVNSFVKKDGTQVSSHQRSVKARPKKASQPTKNKNLSSQLQHKKSKALIKKPASQHAGWMYNQSELMNADEDLKKLVISIRIKEVSERIRFNFKDKCHK